MAADVRDTATEGADDPSAGHPRERSASEIADAARSRPVITMRDIAAVAGVSQSTVSRVLNNAPTQVPIPAETRERVLRAARDVGYRPNPHARGLRGAPTLLLGVVVRDFSDLFFAAAIEALAVEAMGRGYNVLLGHAHGREEEALPLSAILEIRHCDAIVLLGDMQDQPRLLEDLRDSTVPIVALWQGSSPLEFPTVDVDNHAGIYAGMQHLAELGHTRIAFVSGQLPGDNPQRLDAFVDDWAARLASGPPIALSMTKRLLTNSFAMSMDEALEAEGMAQSVNSGTEDAPEAIRAFLEKREPRFKGR
jgi:DNA-binding LacI/PurR family transcriptional regulator